MISKRVHRDKATSDFARLGRYLLDAKTNDDAILWTRTAEYVVDLEGEGDKVAWFRLSHCVAEVPGMAIAEIQATQAKNTRSRADKTYHLVVSFPDGEMPSRAQLEDIEDTLCAALGFGEHQRISAVHQNTENLHLHVAVNKVHPVTLRCVEPYYDYYTRDKTCRMLEKKHGLTVDNGVGQGHRFDRAGDFEAHAGEVSLLSWIKEQAGDALTQVWTEGQSWRDIHQTLADYGLLIRPKGAGLVIGLADGSLAVKASSVDRGLSFRALTQKWGAYEAAIPEQATGQITAPEARPMYRAGLRSDSRDSNALYAEYQTQRQASYQARQEWRERQKEEREQFQQELKDWYATERNAIRDNPALSKSQKRLAYHELSRQRQAAWKAQTQKTAAQRSALLEQHPVPTWPAFLLKAAERGNFKALAILRSRKRKQNRLEKALLTAENILEAKDIVYAHLKPVARPNGDLTYRLQDGGVVIDEKHQVRVDEVTAAASFLALCVAAERFAGQALVVNGQGDFKRQVVQFATQYGMAVTFKESVLEEERQRLSEVRPSQERDLSPALDAYIHQRNQLRERVPSLELHRVWTREDAGEAVYQGRRTLTDGASVWLFKKGETMLVKPVDSGAAVSIPKWQMGQRVVLNEAGDERSVQRPDPGLSR